jgi:hypothetical protein
VQRVLEDGLGADAVGVLDHRTELRDDAEGVGVVDDSFLPESRIICRARSRIRTGSPMSST